MKRILFINLVLSFILIFNSCDTPINKYEAKNDDEKQMMALLQTHLDARNSGDLKTIQSLYHENGVYITGDGIEIPKAKIVNTEPENWVDAVKCNC